MLKKKVDLKMVLGLYFFNPATKQSVTQGGEKIAENTGIDPCSGICHTGLY